MGIKPPSAIHKYQEQPVKPARALQLAA